MEYDLNKPAFGPGSESLQELEDTKTSDTPTEESQPKEEIKEEEVPTETLDEEQKVPYSRFKKYHERAREAEAEAEEMRAKYQALLEQKAHEPREASYDSPKEMPAEWKELYGDSEASQKAYEFDLKRQQSIYEKAREQALEAVRQERYQEENRTKENLDTIETNLEDLSAKVGRDLTKKEEEALLDIVDDYTPKDEEGNYIGATIPFDKAWEIYELKREKLNAPKQKSRDAVASLTSINTQGDTSISEKDKNFNPLDWSAYKKFL